MDTLPSDELEVTCLPAPSQRNLIVIRVTASGGRHTVRSAAEKVEEKRISSQMVSAY